MDKTSRSEQQTRDEGGEKRANLEGLPLESSPYTQYKDLDDYNRQGYGAQGHQQPKPGRGAGATDAPTPSGAAVNSDAQNSATGAVNRQGVP
ncbi:uncharacterized protein LOC127809710 [Diospyros lotus]|uniref:uncharacterized protein LOC127809710 n=1 Tax=Diospyros lotus TaxID=55363 RepID=UPI0022572595|nr:uncharacterized protein LOC127809710 [Diospyros lotus]